MLKECLGELPFVGGGGEGDTASTPVVAKAEGRPVVLADGSYATQTALEDSSASADPGAPKLRTHDHLFWARKSELKRAGDTCRGRAEA